ncbi:MAG TPA: imidazole glycerol phosphate synthase subunit HisH [Planctomycetaceae bacterium]|nr:imidazole glycerol phosphate synthase subunit HisH [Planctomycetaceae bacterium]
MKIVIVDYQMGNLRSVQKALEKVGAQAVVSSDAADIQSADKLILPGVGGFGDAISELKRRYLVDPVREFVRAERPFLGICLGLQMLFDIGYEGGELDGLGLMAGAVKRFDFDSDSEEVATNDFSAGSAIGGSAATQARPTLKVPHMGWNRVRVEAPGCPLLEGIENDAHFYFVHSYYAAPADPSDVWLTSDYGGPFCAAVWRNNMFATQFHPEKSQKDGLQMLKNFAEL